MKNKKIVLLKHSDGVIGRTNFLNTGSCFGNYEEGNEFCKCDPVQELCKRETDRRGGVLLINNKKRKR
jgi:hypothetical protein